MYRAYKAYENQQVKAYVATISEEKREQYRAKTKLRVQKYRAKKREQGELLSAACRTKTRSEKETQHAKWRLQKNKQLENETGAQKTKRNEQRRRAYAEKRQMENQRNHLWFNQRRHQLTSWTCSLDFCNSASIQEKGKLDEGRLQSRKVDATRRA